MANFLNALFSLSRDSGQAILIATDLAARGLDIPEVRLVIHYQVALSAGSYIHRSGRTGRATAEGASIMIVTPNDQNK